jgi:DNA primase
MFPVHAASGERIVGFLGRALAEDAGTPKYLNSPAAALYRKGELLYGLGTEPTRRALAAGARPVLVEGPLDAIAVTSAGAARLVGVAPCGTALTAAQVAPLETAAGSLAERGVLVALDADSGGRQASLRAYELLRPTGAWPTAAVLADGLDPAALAHQHSPEAPRTGLDGATPLADLVVDERLARWADRLRWAEGRVSAAVRGARASRCSCSAALRAAAAWAARSWFSRSRGPRRPAHSWATNANNCRCVQSSLSSSRSPARARAATSSSVSNPSWPDCPCWSACSSIHRVCASHADCLLIPRAAPIWAQEAPARRADRIPSCWP